MVRVGEAAAHRGIALEEARKGVAPQVEHGGGGAGEEEREEERDAYERQRDARRAAADVLARGGAQGGREAGEEPARDMARYGEMWRDVGRRGDTFYGHCSSLLATTCYGVHVEDDEHVEEGAVRGEQHARARQRARDEAEALEAPPG